MADEKGKEYRYFEVIETGVGLYGVFRLDTKVDLEQRTYVGIGDKAEYENSTFPTIQELADKGLVRLFWDIVELDITEKEVDLRDFDAVVSYARVRGFNIEREGVVHNYEAWCCDMKSGYRGKECHIFTPCACNDLRYSISKLDDRTHWQTTYEA